MAHYLDGKKLQADIVEYQTRQTEIDKLEKQQERFRKKLGWQSKEFERVKRMKNRRRKAMKPVTDRLWEMFFILSTNYAGYLVASKFTKIDPDETIQECTMCCMRGIMKFKPDRGTAFNYFTQAIYNQILAVDAKHFRYRKLVDDAAAQLMLSCVPGRS